VYIKVFENRQSSKSYLLQYRLSAENAELDRFHLQNQEHESIIIIESELFKSLDKLFKANKNEDAKERCKENGI